MPIKRVSNLAPDTSEPTAEDFTPKSEQQFKKHAESLGILVSNPDSGFVNMIGHHLRSLDENAPDATYLCFDLATILSSMIHITSMS
jgi:hypothetical protein